MTGNHVTGNAGWTFDPSYGYYNVEQDAVSVEQKYDSSRIGKEDMAAWYAHAKKENRLAQPVHGASPQVVFEVGVFVETPLNGELNNRVLNDLKREDPEQVLHAIEAVRKIHTVKLMHVMTKLNEDDHLERMGMTAFQAGQETMFLQNLNLLGGKLAEHYGDKRFKPAELKNA